MHSVLNGYVSGAENTHDLGEYLPDHRTVKLNGQEYEGWVFKNGGCPREIIARLARAYARYYRVIAPLLEPPVPDSPHTEGPEYEAWKAEVELDRQARERAADDNDLAYARYLTDCTLALVPTIPERDVALVPTERLEALLLDLGFFDPRRGVQVSQEQAADSESAPLTSTSPSPDSPSSTESDQTNS